MILLILWSLIYTVEIFICIDHEYEKDLNISRIYFRKYFICKFYFQFMNLNFLNEYFIIEF